MSLRTFHIVFVISALGLCLFLAFWSVQRALGVGGAQYAAVACASVAGLCAGFPYLYWFLAKKAAGSSDGNAV